jgi:hypothetical protein
MLVVGQRPLIVCQVRQKSKPSDTIDGNPVTVNDYRAVEELAEVIPVEAPAILELLDQAHRIESISDLPELEHHKAADEWPVKRPGGEHAEIVDVPRPVPLITGADFLGNDFRQRKACDLGSAKGNSLK